MTRIEHCVCTPLVENIQSADAGYWFTTRRRGSASHELIEYMTSTKPRLLEA